MNNTFLSIILLLLLMFVILTTLNRGGSAIFGKYSTYILVLVFIMILHFLIKNVLKTRGSASPEEEFKTREKMSCGAKKEADEVEEFDMKNDLLEYVQNIGASRDTNVEVQMKPDTNVVHANTPGNKLAAHGAETQPI